MANNPIVNSLTFTGSVAGQASIQSQGIAGGLTLLLPNIPPTVGQLMTATTINGNSVFLGWTPPPTSSVNLSQITQSSATTGQSIAWSGTAWVPVSALPGEGTVTTFSAGTLAPIFTTSVANPTSTPALSFILTNAAQNAVFAGPISGGPGAPAYRALGVTDIPDLSAVYLPVATVLAQNRPAATHNFITAYDSSTGLFSIAQPATTDISGIASYAPLASPTFTGTVSADAISASTTTLTISGPVSGVQIFGTSNRGVSVNAAIATDGVALQDNTAANAILVSATAGGILLETSGGGTVAVSGGTFSAINVSITGTTTFTTANPTFFSALPKGDLPSTTVYTDQANTFAAGNQQVFTAGGANIAFVDPTDGTKSMYIDVSSVGHSTSVALAIPASTSWGAIPFTPVASNFLTGFLGGSFSAAQPASTDLSDAASLAYLASPAFTGTPTAPTQTPGTANTDIATTAYSDAAVAALSAVVAHLYDAGGSTPAAGNSHIASGSATLGAGGHVNVTLSGLAAFSSTSYVVTLTYLGAPGGTPPAELYVTSLATGGFTINSTDATDGTSVIMWQAIGY